MPDEAQTTDLQKDEAATAKVPAFVTQEQLDSALGGLAEKLSGDQRAYMGRIQGSLDKLLSGNVDGAAKDTVTEPAPVQTARTSSPTLTEQVKQLQGEIERSKQKEARLLANAKRSALNSALVKHGADPDLARLAIDNILSRYGEAVDAQEDDLGGYLVQVDEGDGAKSVEEWVGLYLQTDVGKKLLPPRRNPGGARMPGGSSVPQGDVIRVTRAQASTMDPKTLQSGKVVITD